MWGTEFSAPRSMSKSLTSESVGDGAASSTFRNFEISMLIDPDIPNDRYDTYSPGEGRKGDFLR